MSQMRADVLVGAAWLALVVFGGLNVWRWVLVAVLVGVTLRVEAAGRRFSLWGPHPSERLARQRRGA